MIARQSLIVQILPVLFPFLFHPTAYSSGPVTLSVTDGHDIQFVSLSVAGGSFQSKVTSIAQDRNGFMWFGPTDGLYRYDGYNLKPYRHERGNPNSLSDDSVLVVYRDRGGILWVGTGYGGLEIGRAHV